MKHKKFLRSIFLGVFMMIIPISFTVKADDGVVFINSNGVEMDASNYENLINKLGNDHVNYMSQNEYNRLKDKELTLVSQSSVIIDTIEYSGLPIDIITPYMTNGNLYHTLTASKSLGISIFNEGNNEYYVTASNEWLVMPSVRNFDVIAMRTDDGFTVIDNTQEGTQLYTNPSGGHAIFYQHNGANTVRKWNGFGMSMNLVDDRTITGLSNFISASVTGSHGTVSVSYQHATSWSVTKAQSMDYILNVNGMGGVILFNNNNLYNKYDGMMGVYVEV